jgi:hypothetical protein
MEYKVAEVESLGMEQAVEQKRDGGREGVGSLRDEITHAGSRREGFELAESGEGALKLAESKEGGGLAEAET